MPETITEYIHEGDPGYADLFALIPQPEVFEYVEELGEDLCVIPLVEDAGDGYYWYYYHHPKCWIIKIRKRLIPA